jgi:outer membrane lipoprotein-sorting protein
LKRRDNYRRDIFVSFISFFLLFGLLGCQTAIKEIGPYQPFPGEVLDNPEHLVQKLAERERQIDNLKAIIHFQLNTPLKKASLKEVLILKKDFGIRMETINFMGHPTMYLVSKDKDLLVYFPFEAKFLRTRATRKNFYRWTGVNLDLSQVIKIFLGTTPLSDGLKEIRGIYQSTEKRYILQFYQEDSIREEIWIEADRSVPVRTLLFDSEGGMVLDVSYGQFQAVQNYLLPFSIKVALPKEDTLIKIAYKKAFINQEVKEDVFELSIPEKAKPMNGE